MNEDLAGLNLIELLDRLEPLPEPPPVSMFPQTVGWVWLGITILIAIGWFAYRWRRRYVANAYRRAALQALAACSDDAATIADILRRTCLAAFPRVDVAGLYGEAWLAFLDKSYGGSGFTRGIGKCIASAPYDHRTPADPGLSALAAQWVRQHDSGRPG